MNELEEVLDRLSRQLVTDESLDAIERVQRATDNQGNVVLERRKFYELIDTDDGTVYRLRVKSGVLTLSEAPS